MKIDKVAMAKEAKERDGVYAGIVSKSAKFSTGFADPLRDETVGFAAFGLLPGHEVWVPHISLVVREMWVYHGT